MRITLFYFTVEWYRLVLMKRYDWNLSISERRVCLRQSFARTSYSLLECLTTLTQGMFSVIFKRTSFRKSISVENYKKNYAYFHIHL